MSSNDMALVEFYGGIFKRRIFLQYLELLFFLDYEMQFNWTAQSHKCFANNPDQGFACW